MKNTKYIFFWILLTFVRLQSIMRSLAITELSLTLLTFNSRVDRFIITIDVLFYILHRRVLGETKSVYNFDSQYNKCLHSQWNLILNSIDKILFKNASFICKYWLYRSFVNQYSYSSVLSHDFCFDVLYYILCINEALNRIISTFSGPII